MDFIFHKEIKEIGKKEMRILTGGDNDSPHTHVLHQLYLVYGESRQNMG